MRRVDARWSRPLTLPLRPSLSIASDTAQQSSRFKRVTGSDEVSCAILVALHNSDDFNLHQGASL
jgi:hypothetical protein